MRNHHTSPARHTLPTPKYDILEGGKRIGTVHDAGLAAQICRDIASRDAKAAAAWAVRS